MQIYTIRELPPEARRYTLYRVFSSGQRCFSPYDDLCARARCFDVEQRGRGTVKTPLQRFLCASLPDHLPGISHFRYARRIVSKNFAKGRRGTGRMPLPIVAPEPPSSPNHSNLPNCFESQLDNLYRRVPVILVRSRGGHTRDTPPYKRGHWLIVLSRTR